MQGMQVWSLDQDAPLEKEMETHSSSLAGKSHGQRSLAGYSPWAGKESDRMSAWAHMHTHTHTHVWSTHTHSCEAQALGHAAFSSCSSRTLECRLDHNSWCTGLVAPCMWDPLGSGVELVSPALAGGFLTPEPPGKPHICVVLSLWVLIC